MPMQNNLLQLALALQLHTAKYGDFAKLRVSSKLLHHALGSKHV
jgi:hypothetical protein